jgi:hypothetical protein
MALPVKKSLAAFAVALVCSVPAIASATLGVYASKTKNQPVSHSTHIALMKKGSDTVVTVMPDYQGELEPFAWVMVVPEDVSADRVRTLKREFVSRLDQLSAPRFHEWWEMAPCEEGEPVQDWERSLKASADTAFLGGMNFGDGKKVAKELSLDVDPQEKEGEYTITVLEPDAGVLSWLAEKGYRVPSNAAAELEKHFKSGKRALVAEVDPNRIELIGGDRAQLSPLRFWTERPYDALPLRAGLDSGAEREELIVYVLDSRERYEVKNYKNVFPPTNVKVDYVVKERMGEFFNGLYDLMLQRDPRAFLNEFAWASTGCGQPCATEPLMIHELVSLGGDVFERNVPDEEKNPEPPPLTDEEKERHKASLEGKTPKEKRELEKQVEEERETVAARKALVERHQYLVTRLHYRYGKDNLPSDPKFGPAPGPAEGGIGVPKGPEGELPRDVRASKANKLQARYYSLHPSKVVVACDTPERWRWAKAPREVRILRKVWQADDLARKSRTQIKPAEVIRTPIPSLGLTPVDKDAGAGDAGVDVGAAAETEPSDCNCRVPGRALPARSPLSLGALFVLFGWVAARRSARNRVQSRAVTAPSRRAGRGR